MATTAMFEEFLTDEASAGDNAASTEASAARESASLAKQFAEGVTTIGPAIALAGAAYPVVLALGLPLVLAYHLIVEGGRQEDFSNAIGMMFFGGTIGAGIGLVWATIVAFAILPVVYLFVRSLGMRGSVVRLGAFCGGLVGFVAVLPLFLLIVSNSPYLPWDFAFAALIGPALTTIVGQIGGGWGGWRVRRYDRAVAAAAVDADNQPGDSNESILKEQYQPAPARLQFGIWHLLVISVWFSLLMMAIRMSGLPYGFAIVLLGVWAIFQTVSLWLGGVLAMRIGRWRARRKSRST